MKLAVIAGTSDAAECMRILSASHEITAFTATDYGREVLKDLPCDVHVGRLQRADFLHILPAFDAVIDASHPFAEEVTQTVRFACTALKLPYYRLLRPTMQYHAKHIKFVSSHAEAAACLSVCIIRQYSADNRCENSAFL